MAQSVRGGGADNAQLRLVGRQEVFRKGREARWEVWAVLQLLCVMRTVRTTVTRTLDSTARGLLSVQPSRVSQTGAGADSAGVCARTDHMLVLRVGTHTGGCCGRIRAPPVVPSAHIPRPPHTHTPQHQRRRLSGLLPAAARLPRLPRHRHH